VSGQFTVAPSLMRQFVLGVVIDDRMTTADYASGLLQITEKLV